MTLLLFVLVFSLYCFLATEYTSIQKHNTISQMNLKQLKQLAKSNKVPKYSRMNKAELRQILLEGLC